MPTTSFWLKDSLLKSLDEISYRLKKSRSETIRLAIALYLAGADKPVSTHDVTPDRPIRPSESRSFSHLSSPQKKIMDLEDSSKWAAYNLWKSDYILPCGQSLDDKKLVSITPYTFIDFGTSHDIRFIVKLDSDKDKIYTKNWSDMASIGHIKEKIRAVDDFNKYREIFPSEGTHLFFPESIVEGNEIREFLVSLLKRLETEALTK
jgi:hypothetical protein